MAVPTRPPDARRHFADTFMVAWAPGLHADLSVEWRGFTAARGALAGSAGQARARDAAAAFAAALPALRGQLRGYLAQGPLKVDASVGV
jgi:hypothetical protein